MTGNLFGHSFRVMSFGESHGPAMGVVIDGMPSGIEIDEQMLLEFLKRRRPGASPVTSARDEKDLPEILSGVYQGKSLGTPIAVLIKSQDARSEDYKNLKPRKGHADEAWLKKYKNVDLRGGGRSSGRETVSRVIAGAFAKMAFQSFHPETEVISYTASIGSTDFGNFNDLDLKKGWDKSKGFSNDLACPKDLIKDDLIDETRTMLIKAKEEGESYGGTIAVRVLSPPDSLGQPVFGKIKAHLTSALLSIGAINGVEVGAGFNASKTPGTEFHSSDPNVYGGIQGGITNGETVSLKLSVKPTSSILDVAKKGRHDPCIVPRACVVSESMVWISLLDLLIQRKGEV